MEEIEDFKFFTDEELKLLENNDVELFEQKLTTNYEKLILLQEKIKIKFDKINNKIEQIEKYKKIDKKIKKNNGDELTCCHFFMVVFVLVFLLNSCTKK